MACKEEGIDRASALMSHGGGAIERVWLLENLEGLRDVETLRGENGGIVPGVDGEDEIDGQNEGGSEDPSLEEPAVPNSSVNTDGGREGARKGDAPGTQMRSRHHHALHGDNTEEAPSLATHTRMRMTR